MYYLIFVFISILCVVEAKLESIVIALKNPNVPNYLGLNEQEHKWSAVYYLGIVGLVTGISILAFGLTWWVVPVVFSLLINRRIFFEYALKLFRHRKLYLIEGDQPLDTAVRKVLGAGGGYRELFLLVSVEAILIFLIIKNQ